MHWHCRDFILELNRTLTMGIVNVTPDSFSDGGQYFRPEEAVRRVRNCIDEGADLIDLGGESTRPDSTPISWQEEWSRLEPVLSLLSSNASTLNSQPSAPIPISIDTYHPETAERAIAAGASIINCVKFEPVPAMLALTRKTGCGLVFPFRLPVMGDGLAELEKCLGSDGGDVQSVFGQIMLDPMIGFDTTREEDITLLGSIRRLAQLAPVLVGVSRKRIIKRLTGVKAKGTGKDLGGCLGAAVWCAMAGASVVRVHDVRETVQALRVADALSAQSVNIDSQEGMT